MPQKMKCASFFTLQKKKLFCKKLAACLCIKPSPSPLLEVKTGDYNEEEHQHVEEQSHEVDKDDEVKKDWLLAAAVFDRMCAIAFTVVFIGGNLIFVILFIAHPWRVVSLWPHIPWSERRLLSRTSLTIYSRYTYYTAVMRSGTETPSNNNADSAVYMSAR